MITRNFIFSMLLALFIMSGVPRISLAEEVDSLKKLEECSAIEGRIERLVCYDNVAVLMGYFNADQAEREAEVIQSIGFWEVSKQRAPSGENVMYLKNRSLESAYTSYGTKRYPHLVITCKSGKTDVYIDWKKQITDIQKTIILKLPLKYQFDSEPVVSDKWEISTDRKALFSEDPVEFVTKLRQYNKLIVYMSPPNDLATTMVHDLSGINEALKILVKECYN